MMTARIWLTLSVSAALLVPFLLSPLPACCPAPPSGKPVVNADQTVIIIWDPASQTQHFIRQASFKSEAEDFGFLIPTPAEPELNESGNEAFAFLQKLTEPEVKRVSRPSGGMGCGCGGDKSIDSEAASVRVLQEKLVAGFNAVVLEADSTTALISWLKENGYDFSPQVEAWAKPYVGLGWKFTALKVAKDQDQTGNPSVAASALRMTFKTDRPLFPYREPESAEAAQNLGVNERLLRIYFLSDARYQGELTKDFAWNGQTAWTNKLNSEDRNKTLELLKLPKATGPAEYWLTEFEDPWPYQKNIVPADLYFSKSGDQNTIKRPPIIEYVSTSSPTDVMAYALIAVIILPSLLRRSRRK
jgi:hypothetical protein